ncbi:calcium/sodium antiporter [Wenzhouxiangella sediminis]|uniref:calcium/sodium antiporter n=1 Tax=Wenzhouxiangella sediminis TaxID=1792836 RepID=UPI001FEA98CF|nr:calcium/sodium antiporter [Wenzhouxiangella sediminis]
MTITIALLQMLAGFVLLIWAADRLVAGASALARNFGVSTLVVGLTIVGFGTSAPEMIVSAMASLQGNPSLAIGNALGSNIANIGLILGLTAIIYPLRVESATLKREVPILALIMLLTLVLMWDLQFSRPDGLILLIGLLALIGAMVVLGIKSGGKDPMSAALAEEVPSGMPMRTAVMWTLVGLILLPLSAQVLVKGAVTLALIMGVSEAVVGLTVVALGTSLPELAAAAASAYKREDDLAIGNILGSNMFNLLGVLGIAAVIHPMVIEPVLLNRDMLVMFAISILLLFLSWRREGQGLITRPAAIVLFASYLGYQTLVIWEAVLSR